jgi:hypothetical protein
VRRMTNKQYVESFSASKKIRSRMKKTMLKYGENRWWLSEDMKTIAYYQLKEDTLLVEYEVFHKGVELLFERTMSRYEILSNLEDLKQESEKLCVPLQGKHKVF